MDAKKESEHAVKSDTKVERKSDRELVVTRTLKAPARVVFEAWTKAELFKQWWVPKSYGMTLHSCEMDARVGGGYRLVLSRGDSEPMAFFGKYLEMIPNSRLVWTNEESADGAVTTLTLEEKAGQTVVVISELYPSPEALERNAGALDAMGETFQQLEALLGTAA